MPVKCYLENLISVRVGLKMDLREVGWDGRD
jgi:hypothetical protein